MICSSLPWGGGCNLWTWKGVRDVLMFIVGAWSFHHEVVTAHAERPFIVGAALALMGLPFFLRRDEKE